MDLIQKRQSPVNSTGIWLGWGGISLPGFPKEDT